MYDYGCLGKCDASHVSKLPVFAKWKPEMGQEAAMELWRDSGNVIMAINTQAECFLIVWQRWQGNLPHCHSERVNFTPNTTCAQP